MLNFCTLFDSYYLTRGLALYYSLERNCKNFNLYIYTLDKNCFNILNKLNLRFAILIPQEVFEDSDLIRIKKNRTIAEYCWTCTPSIIHFSIKEYNLKHCTYLDSDIYFFSTPEPIFDEIGNASIGLTPHNFSSEFKTMTIYGTFCVQFVYFRNDENGIEALEWWKKSCIEWCYSKLQDGKYGDQKYLDDIAKNYDNVHIVKNIGSGVAPWNILDYKVSISNDHICLKRTNNPEKTFLIFYHFQGLKINYINKNKIIVNPTVFWLRNNFINYIYDPYVRQLLKMKSIVTCKEYCEIMKITYMNNKTKFLSFYLKNTLRSVKFLIYFYNKYFKKRYNRPKKIG